MEPIILRCLHRAPDRRPVSALAVAAALPGGDALADALAAGETPSPALIAAAGPADALGVLSGIALLSASIAAMLLFAWSSARVSLPGRTPLDRPPVVLFDRGTQLTRALGYTDTPGHEAYQLQFNNEYLNWVQRTRPTPQRWDVLHTGPTALQFWYRTSPSQMPPTEGAVVTRTDPPMLYSGMLIVVVLRLVCRWNWLVFPLTTVCLIVASWQYMTSSTPWLRLLSLASGALLTLVAVRFGLLTLVVTWFVWSALYGVPMTLDVMHWSATATNWTLALLAALAWFGFWTACAGLPLFGVKRLV